MKTRREKREEILFVSPLCQLYPCVWVGTTAYKTYFRKDLLFFLSIFVYEDIEVNLLFIKKELE